MHEASVKFYVDTAEASVLAAAAPAGSRVWCEPEHTRIVGRRIGERLPDGKLTWDSVEQIRKLHTGGESYVQLAEEHGVCDATIRSIVQHRTRKNLGAG